MYVSSTDECDHRREEWHEKLFILISKKENSS